MLPCLKVKNRFLVLGMLMCQICMEVINPSKNPLICLHCKSTICCSQCMNESIRRTKRCPFCQYEDPKTLEVVKDPIYSKLFKSVKYKCPNYNIGCNESLIWDTFEEHTKVCGPCLFCNMIVIEN